ncbi:uncharacterized protein LOC126834556 [Adelges cooleyi]|uniref:uncharacterized protein LOC126834556 n=1 Tax=Adelges cooleyi TaxID=133065 RepID=UPI002180175C|nr:uncharacterized protein LOC126834556 [Adelges cooleyi]XP_050422526.1 uncharacterized protein LOC126834556 [Adelges cooleyi]
MSVIIRLQNLPWAASAADIRQYFQGLSIPEGGVHIVGGEQGDAFIAFSTDEDARQAMLADGGCIKEVKVKLLLSSRNEMQKVIETARQQALNLQSIMQMPAQHPMMAVPPLTAKVLPQPQQPVMPQQVIMQHPQQMMPNRDAMEPQKSGSPLRDHDRRRDRTRSKSRERRSKSTRSGGSRRDRSRSRDRRRRDRSRGRDRSRDRHRSGRDSSSRGSGKTQRSRSPAKDKKDDIQQQPVKPWACHYDGGNQANPDSRSNVGLSNIGGGGHPNNNAADNRNQQPNAYGQFRTPQPPSISPATYQPFSGDFNGGTTGGPYDGRQSNGPETMGRPPRGGDYGNNKFNRRYNDAPLQQRRNDYHNEQQQQQPQPPQPPVGMQNRGPRFGQGPQTQQMNRPPYGGGGGGPPASRFNQDHRPPQQVFDDREQRFNGPNDGDNFNNDTKRPTRFNDRYRYDVRNSAQQQEQTSPLQQQQLPKIDGLCVEVNNMSNPFSYGDIRKLFDGIHIDGSAIKIQKHKQGVAFVKFDDNYNKNVAMKLNGTTYKGSQITVKHLDDEAYEKENTDNRPYPGKGGPSKTVSEDDQPDVMIIDGDDLDDSDDLIVCETPSKDDTNNDAGHSQSNTPSRYLKLSQVPITVTEDEIRSVINVDSLLTIDMFPEDQFLGAILEFTNVDAAESTLKRHDCVLLGFSPVPLLRCAEKEKRRQGKRKSVPPPPQHKSHDNNSYGHHHNSRHPPKMHSNCLYLSGLPTTVTNLDITQFFADVSVLPDKIHIMLNKSGRPTGESYCEFGHVQQAHAAAAAKNQCFMGPNAVSVTIISRSDMMQAITKPMQEGPWGMRVGAGGPRHNMMAPQGGPPPPYHNHNGGPPYMNRPQYMNNRGNMGHPYTPRMRAPGPGPTSGPDGFGQPGCVVALDNVPYRADVQEIVDFFEGFDLNSQNVIRRFNDFGKPTGEARVNLRSPQEALSAVKLLQNKSIHNRPIRLTLL